MTRDPGEPKDQNKVLQDEVGVSTPSSSFYDMVSGGEVSQVSPEVGLPSMDEVTPLDEPLSEVSGEQSARESEDATDGADMPHEARRVLVYLMRQGAVLAGQKAKLFESICRYESQLRRHLSEVYLRLVLDQKAGVAFIARYELDDTEAGGEHDEEFVSLISKRTLSLFDTLLLLVLRKHYQEREYAGEQKITVDVERLESYLTPFVPLTNHAKADRKKLNAAIQKLIQKKVLSAIRGSDDRYEITPIIRYVVDAAFLESMLAEYLRLAEDLEITIDTSVTEGHADDDGCVTQDDLLGGL